MALKALERRQAALDEAFKALGGGGVQSFVLEGVLGNLQMMWVRPGGGAASDAWSGVCEGKGHGCLRWGLLWGRGRCRASCRCGEHGLGRCIGCINWGGGLGNLQVLWV